MLPLDFTLKVTWMLTFVFQKKKTFLIEESTNICKIDTVPYEILCFDEIDIWPSGDF